MNRLARATANFLFPSRCLACRRHRVERFLRGAVCEICWNELPQPPEPRCEVCDEPLPRSGETLDPPEPAAGLEVPRCGRCLLSPPAFRSLRAAAPYRSSAREILIAFKFAGADYLAPRLAGVMIDRLLGAAETDDDARDAVPRNPSASAADEVTAVPGTARSRRRGDHAADLLGEAVADRLRIPFLSRRLEKIRSTERQSGLSLARRVENVRGAFRARAGAPRRVLLVDDVATSGATARECARLLVKAGAQVVDVWCFARASREDMIANELTGADRIEDSTP